MNWDWCGLVLASQVLPYHLFVCVVLRFIFTGITVIPKPEVRKGCPHFCHSVFNWVKSTICCFSDDTENLFSVKEKDNSMDNENTLNSLYIIVTYCTIEYLRHP